MEELKIKKEVVLQKLSSLKQAMNIVNNAKYEDISTIICYAIIHCFESALDSFLKFLRMYLHYELEIRENIDNPKGVIRQALTSDLIISEEFELLLCALADRNSSLDDTMKEKRDKLIAQIQQYYLVMMNTIHKLS